MQARLKGDIDEEEACNGTMRHLDLALLRGRVLLQYLAVCAVLQQMTGSGCIFKQLRGTSMSFLQPSWLTYQTQPPPPSCDALASVLVRWVLATYLDPTEHANRVGVCEDFVDQSWTAMHLAS